MASFLCIFSCAMLFFGAKAMKPELHEVQYAVRNQQEFGHEETLRRLRRSTSNKSGIGNYANGACRPGGFYCGSQLSAMGYRNAKEDHLYECDSAKDALFQTPCSSCVSSNTGQSHCACFPGIAYCGLQLRARNFRVADDHALYRCTGISSVSLVQNCTRRCGFNKDTIKAECLNDNRVQIGRCEPEGIYCGNELGYKKFPDVQYHKLYVCEENGREVQALRRCPSGCVANTTSHCDAGRMLWNPMDGN